MSCLSPRELSPVELSRQLIVSHTSDSVANIGIVEYGAGNVKHEKAAGTQFSAKWL
jgi:hypothetical protein